MNRKQVAIWSVALVGCVLLGIGGYRVLHPPEPKARPVTSSKASAAPVAVTAAPVQSRSWADQASAVGSLRADQSVILRPEVAGRVQAIRFKEGQPVRKGQVLIQLDDGVPQAELQQAKAELAVAQSNLKRSEELAAQQFLSPRALEEQKSSVQVLEAKWQVARAHATKMRLVAPFDGVAGLRKVSIGDYVKEGADLIAIDDMRHLKAEFRFPERFQPRLARGQAVRLTTDALPGRTFTAKVDALDPTVDVAGRSVTVLARLENTQGVLRPGMFVRVTLSLGESQSALSVPESALVPQGSDIFVYRIVEGKALRTAVKTGMRQDGEVQVLSGLQPGDSVVTAGHTKLQAEATPVRVAQDTQP